MTDTTRDLLISLASHMAYMQGHMEAHYELEDPEDYWWVRESIALRQKVTDALLAAEPAVPAPPADGEVAELVDEARYLVRELSDQAGDLDPSLELFGLMHQAAANLARAAELLQRQVLVPVPMRERPWEREGWCDADGRCWWANRYWPPRWEYVNRAAVIDGVMLPAHALPLPEVNNG